MGSSISTGSSPSVPVEAPTLPAWAAARASVPLGTALCSMHRAAPRMWPRGSVPRRPRGLLSTEQRKWRRRFAFSVLALTAAPQWGSLCQGPLQANLQHAQAGAKTALAVTAICRQARPTVPSGGLCPNALWGCGCRKQKASKRKVLHHFWGQTQALFSSAGCTASGSAALLQMGKLRQQEQPCPRFT